MTTSDKLLSKEDALNAAFDKFPKDITLTVDISFEAMDIHSKNTAILFAEWISNHRLDFQTAPNGCFIGLNMIRVTAKELYQLYLESLK